MNRRCPCAQADAGTAAETAVLIDFGMHLDFHLFGMTPLKMPLNGPSQRGGAPIAMAPEIVLPKPGPTTVLDYEHNDSWATGMMFHELLSPQGPSSPVQACSVRVACFVRI